MTILDDPRTTSWADLLADIGAGAKDRDLEDVNPFDQVVALKRAGFGTLRLPAELGGSGLTVPQLFSAVIDVARADPVVAHIFRTHFWFVEERLRTLDQPGSRAWLEKVAEGKIFGNAFSEKGSNAVGSLVFNTRLTPARDGGFTLTGEKFYSTGTLFSDYLTVTATTDHDSVAIVIVPANRAGVEIVDDWDGFGQRRTGTGTTRFQTVTVLPEEVLSDTPYGAEPVPSVQYTLLQLYIHAVVAGILENIVDDGIALLRSRERSFSHASAASPTDDPLLQRQLGELASSAYIARAAVLDAAAAIGAAIDSTGPDGVPDAELVVEAQLQAAKVKVHLDDIAPRAATKLLELGGASAASRQRNLDRHWRNIRTITLHNPVGYKARVVGQNLLHGTAIPANAYF
ncbi:acyl-CoA dehydrogenase family protein [Mycolicibacterium llatzerense]|uniref:acyl-CoA dehydrogenase family protein n=1 Tax=Mycolicibacterium llatzerense TaxID=280871 RepID=UPI0021B601BE|nr:acyl-CoA dehydrogenase family protein [Mycolicibacterium llatzerense]MCT7372193.1 acyl-CoA dehydrogenase [Mycolicibacterium llatzerense]